MSGWTGLPLKGEGKVISLQLTGRDILTQRNHVHVGGGGGARLVEGQTVVTPDFIFPTPWVDMVSNKESTVFGAGMRRIARKLERAVCSSRCKLAAN